MLGWGRLTAKAAGEPGDLRYSLEMTAVVLPELSAAGLGPMNLQVGLQEFVLLEGLAATAADALLGVAATLRTPAQGWVRHWGEDLTAVGRERLFRSRRYIAYISPQPALLAHMNVADNLTLAQRYGGERAGPEFLEEHKDLLAELGLEKYLEARPRDLPEKVYALAVWGRELLKGPRLILWAPETDRLPDEIDRALLPVLHRCTQARQTAVLVAGQNLEAAYPSADRLVRPTTGGEREHPLTGMGERPLTAFLPLL